MRVIMKKMFKFLSFFCSFIFFLFSSFVELDQVVFLHLVTSGFLRNSVQRALLVIELFLEKRRSWKILARSLNFGGVCDGARSLVFGVFCVLLSRILKPESCKVSNDLPFYVSFNSRMFVLSFLYY